MNLHSISLPQFLSKIKTLLKKIHRSHPSQILPHSQKCHQIIIDLITDQNLLNLNSQQLKLFAYELVLFLVQIIKGKQEGNEVRNKSNSKRNQIEKFLAQIHDTLTSIKHLLCNMETKTINSSIIKNGTSSKFMNPTQFDKLHNNLHQYQQQIHKIVSHFQTSQQLKFDPPLQNHSQIDPDNDFLIEEMHRIIQKKEHQIQHLTKSLQNLTQQNHSLQHSLQETTLKHTLNTQSLLENIQKLELQNKDLIDNHKKSKDTFFIDQKLITQNKLSISQTTNEQIIPIFSPHQNIPFKFPIQAITQCTIPSISCVAKRHASPRKFSLEKVKSNKSFRRILSSDERDSISVDKKYSDLQEKQEELYRLLLCQASTIEQLI